jgi:hypothetical protein
LIGIDWFYELRIEKELPVVVLHCCLKAKKVLSQGILPGDSPEEGAKVQSKSQGERGAKHTGVLTNLMPSRIWN